jgi:integrase
MPIWPGAWARRRGAAKILKVDLKAAGVSYTDHEGKVFDFHALRGQFASMLARASVHPKRAQKLLRHSDINLTMNVYTHLELEELRSDLERLPAPPPVIDAEGAG